MDQKKRKKLFVIAVLSQHFYIEYKYFISIKTFAFEK